jgi:serine O-acetyltransferase
VTVFQGATIGNRRLDRRAGSPIIQDDVCIFLNAVIVGNTIVDAGATVGPGAVVVDDVPPGATVVGNPARVIHADGNIS